MTEATGSARQALVVGVSQFGPELPAGEEPDLTARHPLKYAAELAPKMADALARFGYESTLLTEPEETTAPVLGQRVRRGSDEKRLTPDGVRVVCVLSHGELPAGGTDGLLIVGSDGETCGDTDVAFWLSEVANQKKSHPTTLFLLDVCHGGTAARLPWQLLQADGSSRAWVIAASEPDREAFDGRFTRAMIDVLSDIVDGAVDINPTVEFVPFGTLAQLVGRRVIDLSTGKSRQRVTASVLDASVSAELEFFPNPHFRRAGGKVRDRLDATLAAFADELDPGFDPEHFTGRAAGLGLAPGLPRTGHFHGRASQLAALTRWMDEPDDTDTVRVVTGAPGAGKSALLGILVCAAHPTMREATQQLWAHLDDVPSANATLVAVHARQRSPAEIAHSITRQLGTAADERAPDQSTTWNRAMLIDAIAAAADPPLIVVDALDEAVRAGEVARELLLPMMHAQRSDGRPATRVMVGTRTGPEWPQIDPLLAAVTDEQVIDLDRTPRDILRGDLVTCLHDLLRTRAPYDRVSLKDIRRRIATGIADRLVAPTHDTKRWGEFLVAGLFVQHLLTRPAPPTTSEEVDALLADVPTTLPDALEMDLASRAAEDLARPTLTALAHAKGDGLPLTLLTALVPLFASPDQAITPDVVTATLAGNRFYLRYSADTDGTTLYRLFHQGLTDYLLQAGPT